MGLNTQRVRQLLDTARHRSILVVGDVMLDEFLWGRVNRISPEAPVPVVEVERSSFYPGGAANVARNLADFVGEVGVLGVVGKDDGGARLNRLLADEGVKIGSLYTSPDRPTTHKTRVIARHQQVVRVDRETREPLNDADRAALLTLLEKAVHQHDAIIIEDYGKGLLDQAFATQVVNLARDANKIVTVDPNPNNPLDWSRATAVKPNRVEAFLSAGLPPRDGDEAVLRAAGILQKRWNPKMLLVTLGEEGMLLLEKDAAPYHTPTRAKEVFDVSGAGDTAIAFFTLALTGGASGVEAAELANHAAGVVVGKLGTATISLEELLNSFARDEEGAEEKN